MRRAQARQSYIFRYVVILLRVYRRKVTRARRTASTDWWITPGTAGMRLRDLFTTSRDYRESVGKLSLPAIARPRSMVLNMMDSSRLREARDAISALAPHPRRRRRRADRAPLRRVRAGSPRRLVRHYDTACASSSRTNAILS
ncbi:hypothetical protein EVAR_42459_1 [Eumeta japonica]|uniref:Uncharacterized protein n=1 Tax=Eumeta variegata TaxID=151549 RepID=A0A4C1XY34_EUMVA|nr:hypothetical protein EVAR_42459_1 [Eumeta japonica]